MKKVGQKGFSLLEIAVVVAVLGILAVVAIPAYQDYVTRSRRAEAKVALTTLAQLQETFYGRRNRYTAVLTGNDSLDCDKKGVCKLEGGNVLTVDGSYLIAAPTACAGGNLNTCFELKVDIYAGGKQKNDNCKTFTLNNKGEKAAVLVSASKPPNDPKKCW